MKFESPTFEFHGVLGNAWKVLLTLKRGDRLTGMKVLNWIIAFCGLWELGDIVLPFVIGFGNVQAFVWSHIIVGMLLVLASARAVERYHRWRYRLGAGGLGCSGIPRVTG
jgi:hypothetical protein